MSEYAIGRQELEDALYVSHEAMGGSDKLEELDISGVFEMLENESIHPDELREYAREECGMIMEHPIFQQVLEIDPTGLMSAIWLMGFSRGYFSSKKKHDPLEKAINNE